MHLFTSMCSDVTVNVHLANPPLIQGHMYFLKKCFKSAPLRLGSRMDSDSLAAMLDHAHVVAVFYSFWRKVITPPWNDHICPLPTPAGTNLSRSFSGTLPRWDMEPVAYHRTAARYNPHQRRASPAERIQPWNRTAHRSKRQSDVLFLNARLSDDLEVETFGNISRLCSAHYEFSPGLISLPEGYFRSRFWSKTCFTWTNACGTGKTQLALHHEILKIAGS